MALSPTSLVRLFPLPPQPTLTPLQQALARLRAYTPPPTHYLSCPLSRRAAVLILLFPGLHGELKVVLTMRSATLRNYAGQAALPGGKADSVRETPWETARREAHEEIGLPVRGADLRGFEVEKLCELPLNLAKTELGVRPCVAFLRPDGASSSSSSSSFSSSPSSSSPSREPAPEPSPSSPALDVEARLIPRLDPKEVAAVFTAPFEAFLRTEWPGPGPGPVQKDGRAEKWYRGAWTDWHESRWRMHNFYVPRPLRESVNPGKMKAASRGSAGDEVQGRMPSGDDPAPEPRSMEDMAAYRVFGMTARILVDAARVAYGVEPEFEHNSHFGDEEMIGRLLDMGRLSEERKKGEVLTKEVLRKASRM